MLRRGDENLYKMVTHAMVILPSTADVERAFSAMNNIKTDSRSCLGLPSLDALLRIALNGPSAAEFEEAGGLHGVMDIWNTGNRVPQ